MQGLVFQMETTICKVHLSHLRQDFPVVTFNQIQYQFIQITRLEFFKTVSCYGLSGDLQVSSPLKLLGPRCGARSSDLVEAMQFSVDPQIAMVQEMDGSFFGRFFFAS